MKKILSFLILLLILPIIGIADSTHWKTYRFPTHQEYVFALPSTYHVLYEGMPDDSPVFSLLYLSTEKVSLLLQFNSAIALAYTGDFSSVIAFYSFDNYEDKSFDFRDLTIEELEECKSFFEESTINRYSETGCVVNSFDTSLFETDYTCFFKSIASIQIGTQTILQVQYTTIVNGIDLIIVFTPNTDNEFEIYSEQVDWIVQNFIPI